MKRRRYYSHLMKARMEPQVIKEENSSDKECAGYLEAPPNTSIRTRSSKVVVGVERCRSPDSPEGTTTVASPAQSSPTPPATPNVGAPPQPPPNNGTHSPVPVHLTMMRGSGGSAVGGAAPPGQLGIDGPSPPPPNSGNGPGEMGMITAGPASSAPLALTTSHNNPANRSPPSSASSVMPDHHGNAAVASCGSYAAPITRPLVKVRRFLSTLVQFGADIHADIGERVRSLVLSLVSSNLSIEEFHHSLQDVTNFPLRPFVLPFLRAHLPILQREIHTMARNNKQSALHYVRTHEHVILDSANSPVEVSEIFLSTASAAHEGLSFAMGVGHNAAGVKRKSADSISENGCQSNHDGQDYSLPTKRQTSYLQQHNLLVPQAIPPSTNFFDYHTNQNVHGYANQQRPAEDFTNTNNHSHGQAPPPQNSQQRRGDEEWRNIHVMLNCILSMVEKTKRALTILQQRSGQDLAGEWLLRRQDVSGDLRKVAQDILVQAVRQTEERVNEVRKRAEDAVNEVKRQAVAELQKAVATAEEKANELLKVERNKMEHILTDSRKYPEDSTNNQDTNDIGTASPNNGQASQQNHCWNCGRKAHETCSGCNVARYCGPFCQHKDWETHHQTCPSRSPSHSYNNNLKATPSQQQQHHNVTRSPTPTNINNGNSVPTAIPNNSSAAAVSGNGPLNLDKHNGRK